MTDTFIAVIRWIEDSALATWVAESPYGFAIALTLHAIGMGFLAGGNVAIALRLLGAARGIPIATLPRLYPLLWSSAGLSAISGVMLFSAYPAKALTNGVFYFKLSLIATGLWLMAVPLRRLLDNPGDRSQHRRFGALIMLLWFATITAGRLLAYTHHILRLDDMMVVG